MSHIEFFQEFVDGGDEALNLIGVMQAGKFDHLLGPYSRYGFNHPGPVLFYLMAIGTWLLQWVPANPHHWVIWILNTTCIIYSFHCFYQMLDRKYFIPILFALMVFVLRGHTSYIYHWFWGPNVLLFGIMALLAGFLSIAEGKTLHAIPVAFLTQYLIQSHIASIPFFVIVGGIAILLYLIPIIRKKSTFDRQQRNHILIAIALSLILFAPPIIEQFTQQPGNLNELTKFYLKPSPQHKEEISLNQKVINAKTYCQFILCASFRFKSTGTYRKNNGSSSDCSIFRCDIIRIE